MVSVLVSLAQIFKGTLAPTCGFLWGIPIPSMFGLFTYILVGFFMVNVGKRTLHGWSGNTQSTSTEVFWKRLRCLAEQVISWLQRCDCWLQHCAPVMDVFFDFESVVSNMWNSRSFSAIKTHKNAPSWGRKNNILDSETLSDLQCKSIFSGD